MGPRSYPGRTPHRNMDTRYLHRSYHHLLRSKDTMKILMTWSLFPLLLVVADFLVTFVRLAHSAQRSLPKLCGGI